MAQSAIINESYNELIKILKYFRHFGSPTIIGGWAVYITVNKNFLYCLHDSDAESLRSSSRILPESVKSVSRLSISFQNSSILPLL